MPFIIKMLMVHFLGCNTAFASLVSSTKEEIIGKTAFDFFPTEIATKYTTN